MISKVFSSRESAVYSTSDFYMKRSRRPVGGRQKLCAASLLANHLILMQVLGLLLGFKPADLTWSN